MPSLVLTATELVTGERMTVEEFLAPVGRTPRPEKMLNSSTELSTCLHLLAANMEVSIS